MKSTTKYSTIYNEITDAGLKHTYVKTITHHADPKLMITITGENLKETLYSEEAIGLWFEVKDFIQRYNDRKAA